MLMYLIKMFGVSLIFTECIELMTAVCMGIRKAKSLFLVLLVNILTNPMAVFLAWAAREYWSLNGGCLKAIIYMIIEILVVVTEALVYYYNMKESKHPFLFSLCLNGISFGVGCLL